MSRGEETVAVGRVCPQRAAKPSGPQSGAERTPRTASLLCFLFLLVAASAFASEHFLKPDERVVFYPVPAWHDAAAGVWRVPVHALVFEPERRVLTTKLLRTALGLVAEPKDAAEKRFFEARAQLFLVDNERGRDVNVRVGERVFPIGKSPANGHARGEFQLTDAEVRSLAGADAKAISFRAILGEGDTREFRGTAQLLGETGLSVISDVDDTIKVTHVRDRHEVVRRTFYEPFQPVDGMAALFHDWAARGASFHYVSASPWQLYEPLAEFAATNGFPDGSWHLKQFRVKDGSFLALLDSPEKYKTAVIEPLLRQFPKRRFILVGDSGERDPEIYGALARKFPTQIQRVFIRDVTSEDANAARYEAAFKDVPAPKWRVFTKPEEIRSAVKL